MDNKQGCKEISLTENMLCKIAACYKRAMNDLIDIAFLGEGQEKIKSYKRFRIFNTDGESGTKAIDYWRHRNGTSDILISNLAYRNREDVIISVIHILGHHVDFVNRKTSDHENVFMKVCKKLLCAAIDMHLITKEELEHGDSNEQHTICNQKLSKMLEHYQPQKREYKEDDAILFVYGGFYARDELRSSGYFWHGICKAWIKWGNTVLLEAERERLKTVVGIIPDEIHLYYDKGLIVPHLAESAAICE